jgi:DNA-binding transcriptional LysR family regulator
MAVREELKQGELVAINPAGLTITRSFSLVCRKGRTLSPAAVAFSFMVRKVNQ